MKKNKNVTYGLGATDPGKIFSTNKNLLEKFGNEEFLMFLLLKILLLVWQLAHQCWALEL